MSRRVVVTGLGASTPIGTGVEKFWQGLLDCQSGANVIEAFDTEADLIPGLQIDGRFHALADAGRRPGRNNIAFL